jgi:hypothetical protein
MKRSITNQQQINRLKFLEELRSGIHKKGTIRSDERGMPVIETEADNDGHCACAIFTEMFGDTGNEKLSIATACKAIGISTKECGYIQQKLNDTGLNFNQIADHIESEVFSK